MKLQTFLIEDSAAFLSWKLVNEIVLFGISGNVPAVVSSDPNLRLADVENPAAAKQLNENIVYLNGGWIDSVSTNFVQQFDSMFGFQLVFPAETQLWVAGHNSHMQGIIQLFYDELS